MIPESDGAPSKGGLKSGPAWLQAISSWPTFAVLIMLVFWTPLHQIGALVPRLVENSDTVTIGKITLQIRQSLKTLENQAGPEARDALSGMEAEDAMTVLESNLVTESLFYVVASIAPAGLRLRSSRPSRSERMQHANSPPHVQALAIPPRAGRARVKPEPLRLVPGAQFLNRLARYRDHRRHLW